MPPPLKMLRKKVTGQDLSTIIQLTNWSQHNQEVEIAFVFHNLRELQNIPGSLILLLLQSQRNLCIHQGCRSPSTVTQESISFSYFIHTSSLPKWTISCNSIACEQKVYCQSRFYLFFNQIFK